MLIAKLNLLAGHVAFFGFISEMEKPSDWNKALALLQITDTSLYIIVALVVYRYGGMHVASPALGSGECQNQSYHMSAL